MRVLAWLLVFCGVLLIVGPVVLVQIDRARCADHPTVQGVQRCRDKIPAIGFVPATIGLVTIGFGILLLAIRPPRRRHRRIDKYDDGEDDETPPMSFRRGHR
jgi:hypothetical protein